MTTYNIESHALLSEGAKKLEPEELALQRQVAEIVLGVEDTTFTDEKLLRVELALALQVNRQIAMGEHGQLASSESRGGRSITYRTDASGNLPSADPVATKIVDKLVGAEGYNTVRSLRTEGT